MKKILILAFVFTAFIGAGEPECKPCEIDLSRYAKVPASDLLALSNTFVLCVENGDTTQERIDEFRAVLHDRSMVAVDECHCSEEPSDYFYVEDKLLKAFDVFFEQCIEMKRLKRNRWNI